MRSRSDVQRGYALRHRVGPRLFLARIAVRLLLPHESGVVVRDGAVAVRLETAEDHDVLSGARLRHGARRGLLVDLRELGVELRLALVEARDLSPDLSRGPCPLAFPADAPRFALEREARGGREDSRFRVRRAADENDGHGRESGAGDRCLRCGFFAFYCVPVFCTPSVASTKVLSQHSPVARSRSARRATCAGGTAALALVLGEAAARGGVDRRAADEQRVARRRH